MKDAEAIVWMDQDYPFRKNKYAGFHLLMQCLKKQNGVTLKALKTVKQRAV
jgi:hypothetical protein